MSEIVAASAIYRLAYRALGFAFAEKLTVIKQSMYNPVVFCPLAKGKAQ